MIFFPISALPSLFLAPRVVPVNPFISNPYLHFSILVRVSWPLDSYDFSSFLFPQVNLGFRKQPIFSLHFLSCSFDFFSSIHQSNFDLPFFIFNENLSKERKEGKSKMRKKGRKREEKEYQINWFDHQPTHRRPNRSIQLGHGILW